MFIWLRYLPAKFSMFIHGLSIDLRHRYIYRYAYRYMYLSKYLIVILNTSVIVCMILIIFIEARADSSKVKGKVYRVHQMNNLETTTDIKSRTLFSVKNKKWSERLISAIGTVTIGTNNYWYVIMFFWIFDVKYHINFWEKSLSRF